MEHEEEMHDRTAQGDTCASVQTFDVILPETVVLGNMRRQPAVAMGHGAQHVFNHFPHFLSVWWLECLFARQ